MTSDATADPANPTSIALPLAALVAGAVAMGCSPIFVRLADVGPFASAFWRTSLALPVLWAWAAAEAHRAGDRSWRAPFRTDVPTLAAGAIFAGDLFFWHLSILNTTVANATLLATMAPVWVVLGSALLIGERVGGRTVPGLLLCLAGAGALLGTSFGFAPERLTGDAYGVITSFFFGMYFLAVRAARRRGAGTGRIVFQSTAVTAVILLVVTLVAEDTILPRSLGGIAAVAGLAFVSQAAGQGLLAFALGHLPAAFSSLVIFLEAAAAALFAWIFLGESMVALQMAGGILILAGVYIARPRRAAMPAPPP